MFQKTFTVSRNQNVLLRLKLDQRFFRRSGTLRLDTGE